MSDREIEIRESVSEIDNEIFKIFCEVTCNRDFSLLYLVNLNQKLQYYELEISSMLFELTEILNDSVNEDRTKKLKRTSILMGIVAVLSTIFVSPLVGIAISGGYFYHVVSDTSKRVETAYNDAKIYEEFGEKLIGLQTMIENCHTFLNSKTQKALLSQTDESSYDKFFVVNSIIQEYIDYGEISEELTSEQESRIRSMLQGDLGSQEEDIFKLLDMARDKVYVEEIVLRKEME